MKQTIFINSAHKYVWLPVFGKSVWPAPLIVAFLCILSLFPVLNLPSVTGTAQYDTFVVFAVLALAILALRNRASGHYYGEAQTVLKVSIFVILTFIAYTIAATIHVWISPPATADVGAFFEQNARPVLSNAA